MKLWMTGEIQQTVYDAYRAVRHDIETAWNAELAATSYGAEVETWAYLAILGAPGGYPELWQYRPHDGTLEFRLRVPFETFRSAPPLGQSKLIGASLCRSVELMPEVAPEGFQWQVLQDDFLTFLERHGWR
ncbi:MAG TPA: Imm44 family immunity protein [Thermoanaerobaculia bacterium]|nr:Imm44 family immunity protein [Thermoanaerobaculia bacterium]